MKAKLPILCIVATAAFSAAITVLSVAASYNLIGAYPLPATRAALKIASAAKPLEYHAARQLEWRQFWYARCARWSVKQFVNVLARTLELSAYRGIRKTLSAEAAHVVDYRHWVIVYPHVSSCQVGAVPDTSTGGFING